GLRRGQELLGDRAVADDGSGLAQLPDLPNPGSVGPVSPLGDPHQFQPQVLEVVQVLELAQGLGGELGLPPDEFKLFGRTVRKLALAQVGDEVAGTAELFDRLVEQAGKGVDVLARQRVDVAGAQVGEHRVVQVGGLDLGGVERLEVQFAVLVGSKHFGEHADAVVDLGGQVAQEL